MSGFVEWARELYESPTLSSEEKDAAFGKGFAPFFAKKDEKDRVTLGEVLLGE